jgi:CheY-specific phosphatase CheX
MPITHETVEKAAREVVEITAALTVRGASHHAEADGNFAELVGTLSLLGTLGGTLVVYCTWPRAVAIATGMLGPSDEPYDDDTVRDAVGEMVNQIGGTIKRSVGALGAEMLLSPPVVVSGSPLSHRVKSSATPLRVDLDVGADDGAICVCLWPA